MTNNRGIGKLKTCLTGGAKGADHKFEKESIKYGCEVIAYSFRGHNATLEKRDNCFILTQEELQTSDPMCEFAAGKLGKTFTDAKPYVKNLLRRNAFQLKGSHAVFAIAPLENEKRVKGGTGWAVEMAKTKSIPIYVWDKGWFEWQSSSESFMPMVNPPELTKVFTGIGSRNITAQGLKAIEELFARRAERETAIEESRWESVYKRQK
jgi:hypothetical protein